MTTLKLQDLVMLTLRDPAAAARMIMALDLPRGALWTALMLVAVLNTLLFTLSNVLAPTPSPLPAVFQMPAFYFFFVAGGLILVFLSLYWTGRAMGGTGRMEDLMALVIWLQGLRVLVQAAVIVLLLTFPLLSALLVLVAAGLGLWILLHFVDQAHGFGSLGRSAGVLIAGFLAMVLGLSLFLSLIGAGLTGGSGLV